MSERTYVLVLPKVKLPLLNQVRGRHWSVAHRLRRGLTDLLALYARQQAIPPATERRRLALEVILGPRQKPFDADAPQKILLDACTQAGLILDDGACGLDGVVAVSFRRGTAQDWGCVLYLTDLEN